MPSAALPLPPRQQTYVQPWHRQNQRGLRQYVRYSCFPPSICAICAVLILQYVRYSSFNMCGTHPSICAVLILPPVPPPTANVSRATLACAIVLMHLSRVYIANTCLASTLRLLHAVSCICHASVTRLHCQHMHLSRVYIASLGNTSIE